MRRLLPVFIIICSISASTMVAQEVDITKYRTIDGTHNNVENSTWGSAGENLQFLIPPSYPDGMSAPVGMERPNPRHLSNDLYIIGQLVPWLLENLKPHGTFWLFAFMLIPAILITWKLVPETKNRTLEQIEKFWFNRGEKRRL